MLSILVLGDCTVSDIAKKTDISLASASKHIQVLVSCRQINKKKVGRQRICQINLNMLSEANLWLSSMGLVDLLDDSKLEEILLEDSLI